MFFSALDCLFSYIINKQNIKTKDIQKNMIGINNALKFWTFSVGVRNSTKIMVNRATKFCILTYALNQSYFLFVFLLTHK